MSENKNEKSKMVFEAKDIADNKVIAALSYVWILCLVPLLLKKDSAFARAHAKQGLVLLIIEVVGMVIFWIPVIGWLLWIAVVLCAIIGFIQALSGEYIDLPIISDLAKKINL